MKRIYADSIAKARSYHEGFGDVIHDLDHTKRVAENTLEIAKSLDYKDTDFLELCAYWHDVARTQAIDPHEEPSAAMARDDLLSRGANQELANRAYEAIRSHKSTANPVTIEGKIIRDADKLDIFSVTRWKKCAEAGWAKEYIDDLNKTITNMGKYPGAFTYGFTKRKYKQRVPEFLAYYESVKDQI